MERARLGPTASILRLLKRRPEHARAMALKPDDGLTQKRLVGLSSWRLMRWKATKHGAVPGGRDGSASVEGDTTRRVLDVIEFTLTTSSLLVSSPTLLLRNGW